MITSFERYGMEKGVLKGKRNLLLRQLRHKFGELPESVEAKINAIETEEELDKLSDLILDANSLEEMGL
jgi:hypothetical protein